MKVKIIGSRAANPIGSRKVQKQTSVRFFDGKDCFQIDVGNTFKKENDKVTRIFITHLHNDHVCKINSVLRDIVINVPNSTFNKKLRNKTKAKIEIISPRKKFKVGSFSVMPFNVKHSKNTKTYSYRICHHGKCVVWMSDFRNLRSCLKYFKGVDVIFLEASTFKKHIGDEGGGHMAVIRSLEILRQRKVKPKKLFLTHLGKSMQPLDEKMKILRDMFPKFNLEAVCDGQVIRI